MLLATCCENEIVGHVLACTKENIKSPNWRYRDQGSHIFAALHTKGRNFVWREAKIWELWSWCCRHSVWFHSYTLRSLVGKAMPALAELIYDVIRLHGLLGEFAKPSPKQSSTRFICIHCLKSEPRFAANVCWLFVGLPVAAYEAAETYNDTTSKTYCLFKYFELIFTNLLQITDRPDGSQANLRSAGGWYEAIM